jgi:uncharacterized repeat protein (TIGR03803 family)
MRTSLSLYALFAACLAIAACSQATEVSRLQYFPNVSIPHRGAGPLSYAVLHRFLRAPDGRFPEANLVDVNGTLYGTTEFDDSTCGPDQCGTVFSMTLAGREKVLHFFFGGGTDGAHPCAGLVDIKGTRYGTTSTGGTYGSGTVFSLTTHGTENVLHSFGSATDGSNPLASLTYVDGTLYGTTRGGGRPHRHMGTVFAITP